MLIQNNKYSLHLSNQQIHNFKQLKRLHIKRYSHVMASLVRIWLKAALLPQRLQRIPWPSALLAPPDRDIPTSSGRGCWAGFDLVSIGHHRSSAKSIKQSAATTSPARALSTDTLFISLPHLQPPCRLPLFFRPAPPILGCEASRQTADVLRRSARWALFARRRRRGEAKVV